MSSIGRRIWRDGLRGFGAGYLTVESYWLVFRTQEFAVVGGAVVTLAVVGILVSAVRTARLSRPGWTLAMVAAGFSAAMLMFAAAYFQPVNVVPETLFMGAMFIPWLIIGWAAIGWFAIPLVWRRADIRLCLAGGVAAGFAVFFARGRIPGYHMDEWGLSAMVSIPILVAAAVGSYAVAYAWLRRTYV